MSNYETKHVMLPVGAGNGKLYTEAELQALITAERERCREIAHRNLIEHDTELRAERDALIARAEARGHLLGELHALQAIPIGNINGYIVNEIYKLQERIAALEKQQAEREGK